MKFSSKEDIEAPIEDVFDMLFDFEGFERAAMRRGAEVQRVEGKPVGLAGMAWTASFKMRGKRRQAEVELISIDRPNEMVFEGRTQGLVTHMNVELIALSKNRTRMMVVFEIKPLNLSARLLVQSLKLAKTSLTKKYKLRVAEFSKTLEDRYNRA